MRLWEGGEVRAYTGFHPMRSDIAGDQPGSCSTCQRGPVRTQKVADAAPGFKQRPVGFR